MEQTAGNDSEFPDTNCGECISIFRLNVVKTNCPLPLEKVLFLKLWCVNDKVQCCLVKFQLSGRNFDNRSVHLSDPFRSHTKTEEKLFLN